MGVLASSSSILIPNARRARDLDSLFIHHPNVVTIYESGQADDGTPYIAMVYLEGETLRQALARRGALPVAEVAEILQQAARGLHAAHKLGIIHRDLKPDNIFLTYNDDEATLAVAHDSIA
jgi:serine/threonine-protein kinase